MTSSADEATFVGGGKPDHLYTHHFRNGAGKFFNIIVEERQTTIEYEANPSLRNRVKLTVTFLKDGNTISGVTLKRFKHYKNEGWREQYHGPSEPFTLDHFTFDKLAGFLTLLSKLDLASVNERRIALVEGNAAGIDAETERKLRALLIQPDGLKIVDELVRSGIITSHDIVNIGYRKEQLRVFESLLKEPGYLLTYASENSISAAHQEKVWQHFFKRNDWIFGFGLDYRFCGILQGEAHVGSEDVAGRDGAIGDFLMGASHFTVLVEMKRPDTPLFGASRNRAGSWQLSGDLVEAMSQILEQKAAWQIKAETNASNNYADDGSLIQQRTVDPKCILIVGRDDNVEGTEKEQALKRRTFELFRRDSRNIEILTFNELYERAEFIVRRGSKDESRGGGSEGQPG
jgi:hypothetical protein